MLARLRSLWRNLLHRDHADRDLDDEVRAVFEMVVEEKIRGGSSPEQARRAATLELGREHAITQRVREERTGASIDALLNDVRYGARLLRSNPGFTIVVVLSLAVGIGANSAIFSVANALLFRTLPVPDVDRLRLVRIEPRAANAPRFSYPFFEQLRAGFPHPDGLAAMSRVSRMRGRIAGGEIEPVNVQLVSGEFFGVMRLHPAAGRLLTVDDNRAMSAHPVAVISETYWRRRLGGSPDAIGREVELNGTRFNVVGVAPTGFTGVWLESPVDAWIPVMMQSDVRYTLSFGAENADFLKPWVPQNGLRWLELVTRADRPDGPEAVALNAIYRAALLEQAATIANPAEQKIVLDRRLVVDSYARGASTLRAQFGAPLYALMGMVAFLLLIACANTANLLLARATSRQREMAVRLSIGASRGRVVLQLLVESALLATLAALVGLAIAPLASELLVRLTMGVESGPLPFSVAVDLRVLAFTAAITLITIVLFGFAPAWRSTDLSLATALKTGGRGTHLGARLSLSKMLVIAQVALSLLLAVGAGLFARSFGNLSSLPLGYESHVIWASINPSIGGYALEELPGLYRRLIARAEALPGVQSATVAMCGLMTGCRSAADGLVIEGYASQPGEHVVFQENRVDARYFATVGMPLVAGRDFTEHDTATSARVAVINESLARTYFNGRDPIGRRFGYDKADTEIVGVVKDARVNTVREAASPMVFYPMDATPSFYGSMHVRTSGDPDATAAALRKALQEAEPKLPVDRAVTIATLAAGTLRQERLIARLTIVLGGLALALACLGLYGLMNYAVKQRTGELGIRFALGAPRPRVLWMVFRESLTLMIAGVVIGVPIVIAASQLIGSLLFDVSPNDPLIVAGAVLVLFAVGASASYLPAWRASRVDPLSALRSE